MINDKILLIFPNFPFGETFFSYCAQNIGSFYKSLCSPDIPIQGMHVSKGEIFEPEKEIF